MIEPEEKSHGSKAKQSSALKNKIISTLRRASPSKKPKWTSQPHCAFLQLPGELRNQIYDYILVREEFSEGKKNERIELRSLKRPALTATCRQISHEALSYFFRYETFSYTFVLDGHAKLSHKMRRQTKDWLKAANVEHLTFHDLSFGAQLPDVDGPYDANDIPILSEKCELINIKGSTLEVVERERDDGNSIDSAGTLKRREKLLQEMEKIAEGGVDPKNAQKIAKLILKVGGFRFRIMLFYIRTLCLVRDKVSRRLADLLAMCPII